MTGQSEHSDKPLRQATLEQINQPSLSPQQLDELMTLQAGALTEAQNSQTPTQPDVTEQKRPTPSSHSILQWLATAAMVLLAVTTIVFWNSQPDYSRDIAMEVVENHVKLKPLDIATDSMQGLRVFFTQLDFAPASSALLSRRFALNDTHLLGGRYCSIKGNTAAQIRYQSSTGLTTFYQVDYQPERFGHIPVLEKGENPITLTAKGLNVSMWVEMGLLMVLIETP